MQIEAQEFRLVELARRLANVVRPGVVAEADFSRARVRVKYGAPAEAVTDWLPWLAGRAEIEYDREAHRLRAVLPEGGTAEITAPDGLTINGDVTIEGGVDTTGNVTADGNVEAGGNVKDSRSSMQAMRTTYNAHVHGVPPGIVTPPVAPANRMT